GPTRPANSALVRAITPRSSGGNARASTMWMMLWMIASMTSLYAPEQKSNQGKHDVQQVGLDAPLLEHAKPREQPAPETERRHHGLVECRVGHLAMEVGLLRKQRQPFRLVSARAQRPGEEADQHLGKRRRGVLHPGRRRDVAAAPGGPRRHDAI